MSLTTMELGEGLEGLGGARPVELPATKYRQGNRTHYHVSLPVAQLTQIVQRPDPMRPLEGNRRVDLGRANKFADYVLRNNTWVAPAIIVRLPQHEVTFLTKHSFDDGTAWGVLQIPRDVATEVLILDGQHRSLGVYLALEKINERIKRTRETLDKMREQMQPSQTIALEEATLERELSIRKRLGDEHLSIDIAEVNSDKAKQMFGDINNNAKGVNADFRTILDQRDVINRIAIDLIESHPLLQGRVEFGQAAGMSAKNENFLGAKSVADIARSVLVGPIGRVGARVDAELTAGQPEAVRRVAAFLDIIQASFDDLQGLVDGRLDALEVRSTSMLGSATMLRALAGAYYELTTSPPAQGVKRLTRSEMEQFYRSLAEPMRRIPVTTEDELWMGTFAFIPGSSAPQARQGSIRSLSSALVSWALDGLPVAK